MNKTKFKVNLFKLHENYQKHEFENGVCSCGMTENHKARTNQLKEVIDKIKETTNDLTYFTTINSYFLELFNPFQDNLELFQLINWKFLKEINPKIYECLSVVYLTKLDMLKLYPLIQKFVKDNPESLKLIDKTYYKLSKKTKKILKKEGLWAQGE